MRQNYVIRPMFIGRDQFEWFRAIVTNELFGSGFTEAEAIDDADRELLRAVLKGHEPPADETRDDEYGTCDMCGACLMDGCDCQEIFTGEL